MQLPQQLQHFPHPALLIVSDTVEAKFFLLGGDSMEEVDRIEVPKDSFTDTEGKMFHSDVNDASRMDHFVHELISRTEELVRAHNIAHLNIVMPAEVEHAFSSHLPKAMQEKIMRRMHKDLIKEDPLKIVERILTEKIS